MRTRPHAPSSRRRASIRRWRVGLALVLATSCASRTRPPSLPVKPPPPPPLPVVEPPPPSGPPHTSIEQVDPRIAALLDTGELIVGHRAALEAWRPDGTEHRVIASGPALFPRRFGRDHVLVVRPL